MTIQTDNFSAPQRIISAAPDSQMDAAGIDNLSLQANSSKLTLTQKLNAFDPVVHGGELMADAFVGAEFGARVCEI